MNIKGSNIDINPANLNKEEYASFLYNALIDEQLDIIKNEKGLEALPNGVLPSGATLVGFTTLKNYIILLYITGTDHVIATYDTVSDILVERLRRTDLDFDENYTNSVVAKFNNQEEIIIVFGAGNTFPKHINISNSTSLDSLTSYNLFPQVSFPKFVSVEVQSSGGSLVTGTYFVAVQGITDEGTTTNYSQFSRPIRITTGSSSDNFYSFVGGAPNSSTGKSIKIILEDIDTTYTNLRVSLVRYVNGVVSAQLIKTVEVRDALTTIVITGTESGAEDIPLEDIVIKTPTYKRVKKFTQLNDQLLGADLESEVEIDIQSAINTNVTVEWTSESLNMVKEDLGTDNNFKSFDAPRGFAHFEVYALYLQLELLGGSFSQAFHIPGRQPDPTHQIGSTLADNEGIVIDGGAPRIFQVLDTCANFGTITDTNKNKVVRYGRMGVWENQNEVYPTNFPNFAGLKVRHHRFPSIRFMSTLYDNQYGTKYLDTLGIRVRGVQDAINDLPEEQKSQVVGYRILYAKRDTSNRTVIGNSILQAAHTETTEPNSIFNGGGNWITNNVSSTALIPTDEWVRTMSFDMLLDEPSIDAVYMRNELQLTVSKLNEICKIVPGTDATSDELYNGWFYWNQASFDFGSGTLFDLDNQWGKISNFASRHADIALSLFVGDTQLLRSVIKGYYMPKNSELLDGSIKIDNRFSEKTILFHINQEGSGFDLLDWASPTNRYVVNNNNANYKNAENTVERTFLSNVMRLTADIYLGFESQTLIPVGDIQEISNTNFISGGDVYIGLMSYIANGQRYKNENEDVDGIRNIKMFLTECENNVNYRYSDSADTETYFFPNKVDFGDDSWLVALTGQEEPNKLLYNKDFNAVNEYEAVQVYNRKKTYLTKYPYRIIRGGKPLRSTDEENSWRTFLANDFYDTVKNKGNIINIQGWGNDRLLIHHEDALFITRDKAKIETDVLAVTLGSGDLFEFEPAERSSSKSGYAGTQHYYSCILTEFGYLFIDAKREDIFLLPIPDGQIQSIRSGWSVFFKKYLGNIGDNPFMGNGLYTGYDQEHKRLFFGKNSISEESWCLSFSFITKSWIGLHGIKPQIMLDTNNKLFSFPPTPLSLYKHNTDLPNKRGKGYNDEILPLYIDLIINKGSKLELLLNNIAWESHIVDEEDNELYDKTFTSITVRSLYSSTGKILVTDHTSIGDLDNTARIIDGVWFFDELRDRVINPNIKIVKSVLDLYELNSDNIEERSWMDKSPIRGKYFIIRLEYDNEEGNLIYLREFFGDVEQSQFL